jgi:multiple sugar transport system permease protein
MLIETRDRFEKARWVSGSVLPALVLLVAVAYLPIIYAITLGFYHRTAFDPAARWAGLDNFVWLLQDGDLWASLGRSVVFTVGSVGLQLVWGLFFGLLLNQAIRGQGVMRSLVILPYLLPTIVVGLVFKWILNPEYGIVNQVLMDLGVIELPINFFGGLDTAMYSVIGATVWQYGSFAALLILARLQAINPKLYEAAKVSGAGPIRCFFDITLPNLRTTLLLIALLRGIWMFNKFDIIWIITAGGPLQATETLPIYAYRLAFQDFDFGRAAAACTVMFLVLAVGSFIYFRFFDPGREVEVGR